MRVHFANSAPFSQTMYHENIYAFVFFGGNGDISKKESLFGLGSGVG